MAQGPGKTAVQLAKLRERALVIDDMRQQAWTRVRQEILRRWSSQVWTYASNVPTGATWAQAEDECRRKEWLRAALKGACYPSKKIRNIMRRTPKEQQDLIKHWMHRADHHRECGQAVKTVVRLYRAAEVAHALTADKPTANSDDRPDGAAFTMRYWK